MLIERKIKDLVELMIRGRGARAGELLKAAQSRYSQAAAQLLLIAVGDIILTECWIRIITKILVELMIRGA